MIRYTSLVIEGDEAYAPEVVCDACLHPIRGAGNAYWLVRDDGEIHPTIWHTHKHTCSQLDAAIAARHDGIVMSEELEVWLDQLRHNVRRAKRR